MGIQLFKNNAESLLVGSISNSATSLSVTPGTGSKFPSPTGGDYFLATIFEKSAGVEINHEVVKVTAVSGDNFTIIRDFEGDLGTGLAFPSAGGAVYVQLRYTAYGAGNNLTKDGNLSGLENTATARTNIGLGNVDNTSDATKNSASVSLSNKTINLSSNTLTGTLAQFNSALSDADFATGGGTATGNNSGDNAANSLYSGLVSNATHTGEVTGDTALTIATNAVTNAKLAQVSTSTIKGRAAAGTGNVEDLTATQVRTLINVADGATANVGTVTTASVVSANGFGGSVNTASTTPAITITTSVNGVVKGDGTSLSAASSNIDFLVPALANTAVTGFKTATFNSQVNNATTTGAVTIDWTAGQNQIQAEPTGTITYTFTAPPGPCHLQLMINSDGTSTAQTITWPGSVIWFGATWAGVANKRAVINFWYDGTNYFAQGVNQV